MSSRSAHAISPHAHAERISPLSYSQHALWFLEKTRPVSSAYNVPLTYRLKGSLDIGALKRSLAELTIRHESLRTRYAMIAGQPRQIVCNPSGIDFRIYGVGYGTRSEANFEGCRAVLQEIQRPFDLERGPVWRSALIPVDVNEHLLTLTIHHIATDAWSVRILTNELGALYGAQAGRYACRLPPPVDTYANYAVWQQEWMQTEAAQTQLAHWKAALAGAPAGIELRPDHAPSTKQSSRGGRVPLILPRETCARALNLCRRSGVTLQTLMTTAFQLLLCLRARQDDIVVAIPVADRLRKESHSVVGYFVNTVPLRLRIDRRSTFQELLESARQTWADALRHREFPFSALIAELRVPREGARNPLCQVMVSVRNAYEQMLRLPGLQVQWLGDWSTGAKFDLTLVALESWSGISARIEYSADLFDRTTVESVAESYNAILTRALDNPRLRISDLGIE